MKGALHYTDCGLRNVWLRNGFVVRKTPYGRATAIHDVAGLHRAIGLYLVNPKPHLAGSEVRFLRKEIELSQTHLAKVLGVGETSVRGWESNRGRISRPADRVLRVLYVEHVRGDGTVRAIVDRLAELNREAHIRKLEMEETGKGWRAEAA